MTWREFGDRKRFALGFELVEDPDLDGFPARRASWGKLQIWAGGRNLTAGISATGEYVTEAQCPLLPIIEWLISQWDPMLHEERFPRPFNVPSSAAWYLESLSELPSDNNKLDELLADRQSWWERHGLGSALPDYRIPDVHFRRTGEMVEISWDDREWRAVPNGVILTEAPGAIRLATSEVVDVLVDWCKKVLATLAQTPDAIAFANELSKKLEMLRSPERRESRLLLAAGEHIRKAARHIRQRAGLGDNNLDDTIRALLGIQGAADEGFYSTYTLPVLLYRSASPQLSDNDLNILLDLCNLEPQQVHSPFQDIRRPIICPLSPRETTQEGYDLALEFRETFKIPDSVSLMDDYDLENRLLPQLGVRIVDVHLSDSGVEGVAVLRPGFIPTIAINRSGRFARTPWGRRMTLAHELFHLLHDGEKAGPVGLVSNAWAPYLLERRANAFAAMLLAPEATLAAVLDRRSDRWTRHDLKRAMATLGIGITTLTRQLYNLRWISESEREAWVDDLTASD